MTPLVGLIDYGMGNLHSVQEAFKRLNSPLKLVKDSSEISNCEALILPGVGSFDPAMSNLHETGLVPVIKDWAIEGRPLLGICLGLQLLFEYSDEGTSKGLSLFKGAVHRLPDDVGERIPHMGWTPLKYQNKNPLLDKSDDSDWMYFVHSYAAYPKEEIDIAATVNFGPSNVTAIVWNGRLGACQFHPEKSSLSGQKMLSRWIDWLNSGAEPPIADER